MNDLIAMSPRVQIIDKGCGGWWFWAVQTGDKHMNEKIARAVGEAFIKGDTVHRYHADRDEEMATIPPCMCWLNETQMALPEVVQ
jgi:hypothetical protein